MVVATAGTTGAGMIDPLHACADVAQRERLWYHVDAAWGGAALASNRLRRLLAGIERADSVTIDAHKWLATTMGCAVFITRHAHLLVRGVSRLDELHAVQCGGRRSVSQQRAMVAPLPGIAPVPRPGCRRLGWLGRARGAQRRGD